MARYFSKYIFPCIGILMVSLVFCYGHRNWNRSEYLGNALSDAPKMFFPLRDWGFSQIQKNQIPLWNPMILCGMPNVAELQSAIFYPPNVLFVLFDTARAFNLSIAFHLWLSGFFTYLLLTYYRCGPPASLAAAWVYMLGAPQVTRIFAGHLTLICVLAWAPLLLLLFDKAIRTANWRTGLFAGGVLGLQLLAGYPQCVLYSIHSILALGLGITVWKFKSDRDWRFCFVRLGILAVGLLVGFGLAALQLFPAWEFVLESVRNNLGPEWTGKHSLPPESLMTVFFAGFFGEQFYWGREYLWESMAYVGIITVLFSSFALINPRRPLVYFFAGLACTSVLLALSRFSPLYAAYHFLPGFSLFRGHAKYLVTFVLAAAVLTGFGLDSLRTWDASHLRSVIKRFFGVWLFCVSLVLFFAYLFYKDIYITVVWHNFIESFSSIPRKDLNSMTAITWNQMLKSVTLSLVIFGGGLLYLYYAAAPKRPFYSWIGTVLVLIDLSLFAWKYFLVTPVRNTQFVSPSIQSSLFKTPGWERKVMHPKLPVNWAMTHGIASSEGYVGNVTLSYNEFFRMAENENPSMVHFNFRRTKTTPESRLFGEKVGPATKTRLTHFSKSLSLPRSFLLPQNSNLSEDEAFEAQRLGLSSLPSIWPESLDTLNVLERTAPKLIAYTNRRIHFRLDKHEAGYLFLSDTYYPSWKVSVDGKFKPIHRAFHTFRAVPIDTADKDIVFFYDPLSFRLGIFVSLLLVFVIAGYASFQLFVFSKT